ncbi:MAG: hypothetical protein PXX77_06785 [Gallionella sp.]|nr:hypothetical protein [Gallionella sp.]
MSSMSGDMKRVMMLIDDKSTLEEVTKRAPPSLRGDLPEIIQNLIDAELIRDKDKVVAAPKIVAPKIVAPKPVTPQVSEELDFTSMVASPTPAVLAEEAAKLKAQHEAELKAKQLAEAARLQAEQEALRKKSELEAAARVKAEADAARIKAEQEAARQKAEMEAAKARAEAEEKAKALAQERARQEAEAARLKAEQEAARIKAEQEAARVKAELAAAEKAKAEAEAARIRAEQEAARVKAELEAAKARAEAEAKALAEERARQEAELARLKAEQEAARIKAEQEAARIKAEQEAAARAKAEAEEKARQEAEAARIRAEQEAARIKAEQEAIARAKAEAEVRARQEAEAARIKAEQEAARIKAEQEAAIAKAELEAAKARAEAEAKALAEERAKREAEAAQLKAEQEVAKIKAEQQAAERAKAEAVERANAAEAARVKAEQEAAALQAAQAKAAEKARHDIQSAKQETSAATAKNTDAPAPFQINLDLLNANIVAPESVQPAPHLDAKLQAEQEAAQRAAAEAKALEEQKAKQKAAEEIARLKEEQKAERVREEQEARAKEEEQALAAEQANAWAEAEQRAKLQANLNAEQAAQQAAIAQAKAVQKPTLKARRKPLPLGRIFMGFLVLGVVVIFVLPLVWPLQEFIAPIEKRISAQLKQPVKIGGMSAAILPMPKVELQNVSIGAGDELKASTVAIYFDPLTLLSEQKVASDVEFQGVNVDGRRLEALMVALKGAGGDAQYRLRHMTIQGLQINAEGIVLPSVKGSADIVQGQFTRVVLHSEDDKFNVEIVPVENRWQLSFGIKEGTLPLLPDVMFSDFTANGLIGDGEVDFSEIDAHAYGGILSARGKLTWRKGWQAQGRIQAKTMELEKLFPKFGLSGEVFADGTFLMQGAKLAQLGDAPKLDGSFSANKGVINGMDMVETARLSSRDHLPGGRTHFDVLTGAVQLENHNRHFRQVKIASGMLNATGSFDISADDQISGSFNAEIKMRAGNNSLALSGTLEEPKLQAR